MRENFAGSKAIVKQTSNIKISQVDVRPTMSIDLAITMLKSSGILRSNPIPAKEGGVSPVHVEVKGLFGSPSHLNVLADGMWELMGQVPTTIAAMGYGGISLATAISIRHGVNLTLVREYLKPHGKRSFIEGYVPTHIDRVAVVDDKIVTGQSVERLLKPLLDTGAYIVGVFVAVDIVSKRNDTRIHHLITLDEL